MEIVAGGKQGGCIYLEEYIGRQMIRGIQSSITGEMLERAGVSIFDLREWH